MPVNHRPRTRGKSKYGLGRTVRVLLDLFTVKFLLAYGTRPGPPLREAAASSSAAPASASSPTSPYIKLFQDEAIGGRPLLLLGALLFLTGVILVCFGLLGELLVRTTTRARASRSTSCKELQPAPKTARTSPRCAGVDRGSSS